MNLINGNFLHERAGIKKQNILVWTLYFTHTSILHIIKK